MTKDEYKYGRDKEREVAHFFRNEKARIAKEHPRNFWFRKTPCWEMSHCLDSIKNVCPAPKHPSLPCWQIEGTYCKLGERNDSGGDSSICKLCRVYKQYGGRRSLKLKLFQCGGSGSLQIKLFTHDKHHRPVMLTASSEGKRSNTYGPW